jgi:hypothetical protein
VIQGAKVAGANPVQEFNACWNALKAEFEPNKVADSMRYQQEVKAVRDSDASFTECKATFTRLKGILQSLNAWFPEREEDQIVLNMVKNPGLMSIRQKLLLDSVKTVIPAGQVRYDAAAFFADAAVICSDSPEIDQWGKKAGGVVYYTKAGAGGGAGQGGGRAGGKFGAVPKSNKSKQASSNRDLSNVSCFKCGGKEHLAVQCTAKKCTKCGCKLGPGINHSARNCVKGAQPSNFSKGGDREVRSGGAVSGGSSASSSAARSSYGPGDGDDRVDVINLSDHDIEHLKSMERAVSRELQLRRKRDRAAAAGQDQERA